jgi:hypothetical protein
MATNAKCVPSGDQARPETRLDRGRSEATSIGAVFEPT